MSAISNTPENADKLATAFVKTLTEWLTAKELTKVRIDNARFRERGDALVCASHDVCDANMAMLEAFRATFDRAPYCADDVDAGTCTDAEVETECALWCEAWALADRNLVAPKWQVEFPDFPAADLPAIPDWWVDQSWKNDSCPFWVGPPNTGIFVDYADPAWREFQGGPRFVVVRLEMDGTHPITPDADPLLVSDDWDAVTTLVESRRREKPVS